MVFSLVVWFRVDSGVRPGRETEKTPDPIFSTFYGLSDRRATAGTHATLKRRRFTAGAGKGSLALAIGGIHAIRI
jgi:hypothetical protein